MLFANLHHHTTFSFGDGYGTPKQHVERAAELGYSVITATEHGNVSSHFQLEKAALKAGIKPIFGLEAYCGPVDEENRGQYKYHLTVLAANPEGYRNLNRIVTESWAQYYYHPTVSGTSLADCSTGLIILSGCSGSLLACTLLGGKGIPEPDTRDGRDWAGAEKVVGNFLECFGDRYYLEIQPFPELEKSTALNTSYIKLGKYFGIPVVVTHDVHYPRPEDGEMQAILHAVHRGKASVDDAMRGWNYEVPMTLPSSDKALAARLRDTGLTGRQAWSAIETSAYIAEQCNVTLPKAERLRYPIEDRDLKPWT